MDGAHSEVVNKILDQALKSDAVPHARIHHPFILDALLSVGLLVAVGGFTLCLLQLYVAHTAQQCLIKHDYKSAIVLLSSPSLPEEMSSSFGYDSREILNEALYKDAISKIEVQGNTAGAVKELQKITPGSDFFYNAQRVINEETPPSSTILKGRTSMVGAPVPLSSSQKLDNALQSSEDRAEKE